MTTISESGSESHNAGTITVSIADNPNLREMSVTRISSDGSETIQVPYSGELNLLARGGNGADGVIGRNGRDGHNGINGSNATKSSAGTNGTSGGDGENASPGTNGGPAGNGGIITIDIDECNKALLDIVHIDVSAGIPGAAGRHGVGGRGGRGGRGGSSCSWSEPVYTTRYRTVYTPGRTIHTHDGGTTHTHGDTHQEPYTEVSYITQNQPGGCNGSDGRSGSTPGEPLYRGASGNPGSVQIRIFKDQELISRHSGPYRLTLTHLDFRPTEHESLFEPGDLIKGYYQVSNYGRMSSPKEEIPLNAYTYNNNDFEQLQPGTVLGEIPSEGNHTNEQSALELRLHSPVKHAQSRPYTEVVKIRAFAKNIRLNRDFYGASTTNSITLQYPVQLEVQQNNFSIAPDESQLLQAQVKNISAKTLGVDAGREVVVEIAQEGEDHSKYLSEIGCIKAGQVQQVSTNTSFKPTDPYGATQCFNVNLYLQPIDRSKEKTLIQQESLTVQLSPKYKPTKNGFLLVINSQTSSQEIAYWQEVLGSLSGNNELAIWNTSYYKDKFQLDGEIPLLSDTTHGTVIILDNNFNSQTDQNTKINNSKFLTKEQLLKSGQSNDASLVLVGNKESIDAYGTKEQITWNSPISVYDSIDALCTQFIKNPLQSTEIHQVSIPKKASCWSVTRTAEEQKDFLHQQLEILFPNRRYHVHAEEEDQQIQLSIRRLPDPDAGELHRIPLSEKELADPKKHDLLIKNNLIASLPFTQKLKLFTQTGNPYQQQLAQSIVLDLLSEQSLLLSAKNPNFHLKSILKKHQNYFVQELRKLNQLVMTLNELTEESTIQHYQVWSPLVIQLIAKVHYEAQQHFSLWERFKSLFSLQVRHETIKGTLALCEQALDAQSRVMHTSRQAIQEEFDKETQLIKLTTKIDNFLEENEQSKQRQSCFFCKKPASEEELLAVQQMRLVCIKEASSDSVDPYNKILGGSKSLKSMFSDFQKINYVRPKESEVGLELGTI